MAANPQQFVAELVLWGPEIRTDFATSVSPMLCWLAKPCQGGTWVPCDWWCLVLFIMIIMIIHGAVFHGADPNGFSSLIQMVGFSSLIQMVAIQCIFNAFNDMTTYETSRNACTNIRKPINTWGTQKTYQQYLTPKEIISTPKEATLTEANHSQVQWTRMTA